MQTAADAAAATGKPSCSVSAARHLMRRLQSPTSDLAERSYATQKLSDIQRGIIDGERLRSDLSGRRRDGSNDALAAALRAMWGVDKSPTRDIVAAIYSAMSDALRDDLTFNTRTWSDIAQRLERAASDARVTHARGTPQTTKNDVATTQTISDYAAHLLFDRPVWLPTSPLWDSTDRDASERKWLSYRVAYTSKETQRRMRREYAALDAMSRAIDRDQRRWGWAFYAWRRPGGAALERDRGMLSVTATPAGRRRQLVAAVPPSARDRARDGPWTLPDATLAPETTTIITPAKFMRVASTYRDRAIQHTCRWLGVLSRADFLSHAHVTNNVLGAKATTGIPVQGAHEAIFCRKNDEWAAGTFPESHPFHTESMSHLNLVTMIEVSAVWSAVTDHAKYRTMAPGVYVHRIFHALWRVLEVFEAASRGVLRRINPAVDDIMRAYCTSATPKRGGDEGGGGGDDESGDDSGSTHESITQAGVRVYPPLYMIPTESFRRRDDGTCAMEPVMRLLAHYADETADATTILPTWDTVVEARAAALNILESIPTTHAAGEQHTRHAEPLYGDRGNVDELDKGSWHTEDVFAWVVYNAASILEKYTPAKE